MHYKNLSQEQLEGLEQVLAQEEGKYAAKISVYKEMHRRLLELIKDGQEKRDSLEYVEKKLVFNLVHYGTYLKMQDEKNEHNAVSTLKQALGYDKSIPVAAYRLGFLSYRNRDFLEAQRYFRQALRNHESNPGGNFKLTDRQTMNAHLYLTNSALHIAKTAYEELKKLPKAQEEPLPGYDFSELYSNLEENDRYLKRHAFYAITPKRTETWSKEKCETLAIDPPQETIILYFNDRNIRLVFNDEEVIMGSPEQGKILRLLLHESSHKKPATRFTLQDFFENAAVTGEVSREAFRQAISRLRRKLADCGLPQIIQRTSLHGELAYYYDDSFPYIIMCRVDE